MGNSWRRSSLVLGIAAALALAQAPVSARQRPRPPAVPEVDSVPFQRAAGRIIVMLAFQKPDGQTRPALAWVNMGTPKMALSAALARELGVSAGRALTFRLGPLAVEVAAEKVEVGGPKLDGEDALAHLFAPLPVEAILSASVLQQYQLVLDMPGQRLTLAPPGTVSPQGDAIPIRINSHTGVIAVETAIAGERHLLALDAGASFTWMRGDLVRSWLEKHPEWLRAEGAVGASNMGLTSFDFERRGTLVRLPSVTLAERLTLSDVDVLGTGPFLCRLCDRFVGDFFWDSWERNAPAPVAGWLGADALSGVRLTVDYPNRTLYWLRQRSAQPKGIAEVGLTLERHDGDYTVGGIVTKEGRPTVDGIERGDRLLAVDGRPVRNASSDELLRTLGGAVGDRHVLTIDRAGRAVEVTAPVSAF